MDTRRGFLGKAGSVAGVSLLGAPASASELLGLGSQGAGWQEEVSQPRFGARSSLVFIPMRDGVRLAARMVMPDGAGADERFPALLNYSPYRETESDQLGRFGYFAERGYVGVQVDVRGTGTSTGLTTPNEYSEQEREDALDVIEWLASREWSNGNVGMFGSSYGGFNSTQIAMLHPPALKAIVPMHATDDVFTDDIVYYDGALQFDSIGRWPFSMIASMGIPAWPDYDPDSEEARYRVEHEPWIFDMLRHQRNEAFWQRMSLRPDYDAIEVPTMMIGGWLDAYTDSIPRMLERMSAPTRAIIGQWTHAVGKPGPPFNVKPEMLRWWDHWLKDNDTGMMDEPSLAMYVNESYKPSLEIETIPGGWRSTEWPPKGIESIELYPQPLGALAHERRLDHESELEYKATVGMTNRYRCPHNAAELPIDQRADDAYSMTFDTDPLDTSLEILGFPQAVLHVSASAPQVNWIVRLCDVAPDGTSTLVSKGILNGAHRDSHVDPAPLTPDEVYELEFNLKVISWVFPPGHRVRVAIANADFPNLWPTPYPMSTKLFVDADRPSRVVLPVVPVGTASRPYEPPALEDRTDAGGPSPQDRWEVTRDEMDQTVTVFRETIQSWGDMERRWCTASDRDPARATIRAEGSSEVERDGRMILCNSWMMLESSADAFTISVRRELRVNGELQFEKEWADTIPRSLV